MSRVDISSGSTADSIDVMSIDASADEAVVARIQSGWSFKS